MKNQPRAKFTQIRGWSLTGTRQHQGVKGGLSTEDTVRCVAYGPYQDQKGKAKGKMSLVKNEG